ncbi:G-protein coupled receptor 157-like isoform X1 [Pecten maximus]|uniref:G-protein coupled receptor 157-like isoform X1 n=1 Tax=Pecten maximus TaxID=6579 RepID=UPI0014583797|nr:G-protein coupled receptor 157-like isoform X1 [Pecten maximus]
MASQLYLTTSAITCASASLSVLSGLAIIWSYRQFPQLQNFTRYLLVCLTVADIFTAYGNFISTFRWLSNGNIGTKNDGFCIVQSFITTTSALSSFFWTTTIAIYLYSAVALRANIAKKLGTRVLMTLIPIFVPVTITSVALGYGALGEDDYSGSGPWCWINSDVNNRLMWKVVAGKGWEILTYIITLVIYILLKFFKWRENRRRHRFLRWSDADPNLRDADDIFEISWLFLLVARIWGTLRFILETADVHPGETIADILLYIQCFGDSSQAFWNFVFFFTLDPELREHIYHRKYCLRRRDASAVRINE